MHAFTQDRLVDGWKVGTLQMAPNSDRFPAIKLSGAVEMYFLHSFYRDGMLDYAQLESTDAPGQPLSYDKIQFIPDRVKEALLDITRLQEVEGLEAFANDLLYPNPPLEKSKVVYSGKDTWHVFVNYAKTKEDNRLIFWPIAVKVGGGEEAYYLAPITRRGEVIDKNFCNTNQENEFENLPVSVQDAMLDTFIEMVESLKLSPHPEELREDINEHRIGVLLEESGDVMASELEQFLTNRNPDMDTRLVNACPPHLSVQTRQRFTDDITGAPWRVETGMVRRDRPQPLTLHPIATNMETGESFYFDIAATQLTDTPEYQGNINEIHKIRIMKAVPEDDVPEPPNPPAGLLSMKEFRDIVPKDVRQAMVTQYAVLAAKSGLLISPALKRELGAKNTEREQIKAGLHDLMQPRDDFDRAVWQELLKGGKDEPPDRGRS